MLITSNKETNDLKNISGRVAYLTHKKCINHKKLIKQC